MEVQAHALRALRFRRVAWTFGVFNALMGVAVLVGWLAEVPALTRVLPGLATMKPNTAAAFVGAGLALALAAGTHTPARWRTQRLLGAAVAVLGLLTVAQYLLGRDLGIDELLMSVPVDPAAAGTAHARMALATALGFSGAGLSLLADDARPGHALVAQLLALVPALIGLLAMLGYALDVNALYGLFMYSSVALHTAAGLALLGTGALLVRTDRGLVGVLNSAHIGGTVARTLLPYAVLAPLFIAWARHRAEGAGLVSTTVATAVVNLAYTALFSTLILRLAYVLNRVDRERAQAHESESRQRQQYNGIIETAMDAVVVVDDRQRVVIFNPAAEAMFQRRAADVIGHPLDLLMPPAARSAHAQHVQAFGRTQGQASRPMGGARPVTGVRASGETFPIEASISKLEVDGQRLYTSILRDITQRRRTEAARDEAERASRTKSSFLANMSHEIRTPLNAIIGLTHLLRRDSPTPQQAQRLDKIDTAGQHLLSLINDVLDISKIESGQLQIEQTDFHL